MIDLSDWSLIPGPITNPPASSVELDDLIEYSPIAIAEAILSHPGMRQEHPADPDWWHWVAKWQEGERFITLNLTLLEAEEVFWGGSNLSGVCNLQDVLGLWGTVRNRCPGVWMHNSDCEIHTPDSFRRLFGVDG